MKHINIIGKKYNKLTVIDEKRVQCKDRVRYYLICLCECGNRKQIEKSKVVLGITKSCGCLKKEYDEKWGDSNALPYGEAAFNEVYNAYKRTAIRRGYVFELTKEQFKEIVVQPCIYCGDSLTNNHCKTANRGNFEYTGIDRYDNSKGYIIGNCVPCCKVCNRLKTNMSLDDFESKISKILERKNIWRNYETEIKQISKTRKK